jgi:hypothetical protein
MSAVLSNCESVVGWERSCSMSTEFFIYSSNKKMTCHIASCVVGVLSETGCVMSCQS